MDTSVYKLVWFLQSLSPELLSLITFLVCAVTILWMMRFFAAAGLYVYNVIAVVVANIQVLHLAKFATFPEPLALGMVVFATTYLVSDILVEHYGAKAARRAISLSFISQILVTVLMVLTLGHPPLTEGIADPQIVATANTNYQSMFNLFTPTPRLLFASLISYALSQLFDIWVFQKIKNLSHGRFVWLRQNVSTLLSGLLDSFIFGYIAFVFLNPTPISFSALITSYVLGTYVLRQIINLLGTPVMYLSYRYVRL